MGMEEETIKELVKAIDSNNSGTVSAEEWKAAFEQKHARIPGVDFADLTCAVKRPFSVTFTDLWTPVVMKNIAMDCTKFYEQQNVKGNYKGQGIWYSAKVNKENEDGTYDLQYGF